MPTTIPNLLTGLRILLIPVFILFFYLPVPHANLMATLVFGLAALTDWFDGYLARRLKETSAFGAFLDPVADKLMVVTALVLLVERHPHVWFTVPAIVIIGREITISALREWMAEVGESARVAVSMIGKIKTTVQMVALFLLIYREPLFSIPVETVGLVCFYLAAVLTLWSMAVYLRAAWPTLTRS
ncbi:MAG TPA: CDP-diacylglycerol--glycerol-3-phosphate 3-phosphatidyltransferase [Thiotrichales bacterium]|nr:CDP-diacylglycerol--glycerol-3-phosphate 3-phosphatidyltransferase [Thiotrichales bacterium]